MEVENIKDKLHKSNYKFKNININKIKSVGKANRKKDKEVVVFDIGTSSIKVLIGKFYRNKVVVRDCIIEKTPEGSVIDGAIINILALESVVKKIIEENDINIKIIHIHTNKFIIHIFFKQFSIDLPYRVMYLYFIIFNYPLYKIINSIL